MLTPIDKAKYSTTPLVAVFKLNGAERICGDFKVSLNPHLNAQRYPLPPVTEVLQTPAGGQRFFKIDLADAYLQVELDEDSRMYIVLTTHKGLFRIHRLACGLSAAPTIFQSIIEQILRLVQRAQPYLDDLLVTGGTTTEHLAFLRLCFDRLRDAGI